MEILFLGTGAADFMPSLDGEFSDCYNNDARRSASVLIDGRYLVDCGPHTLHSLEISGQALSGVSDLFLTHLHPDHYDPESVKNLLLLSPSLKIHVRNTGAEKVVHDTRAKDRIFPRVPFETFLQDTVTVSCVPANHTHEPLHYIFSSGGKKIFYGCDGAWMLTDSFNFIKDMHFDLMILDATVGDYSGDWRMAEHNSIPMLRLMRDSFMSCGVITPDTSLYLSHLAHSLHRGTNDDYAPVYAHDGFIVAVDGMRVEVGRKDLLK